MTKIKVVLIVYETEIHDDGRKFFIPEHVADSLGLWCLRDKTRPQEIDVVIRTTERQLVLADRFKMTSGTEIYVADDRLRKFGLQPKDSIIVEVSAPNAISN